MYIYLYLFILYVFIERNGNMIMKSCITKLNANLNNSLLTDQVGISKEKFPRQPKRRVSFSNHR